MKNKLVLIKNIFCVLTVIWSSVMFMKYVSILIPIHFYGVLYYIFDFFLIFLYLGIWCVPILFVISSILIILLRKKYNYNGCKLLNIITIVIPIILTVLMLLTDFNSLLQ